MAELHDALKVLSGVEWDEVPKEGLDTYMSNIFTSCELICNSVPQPPNGTPFQESKPHFKKPNEARGWKETYASPARAHPPHHEHEDLQKNWGKPIKYSQKENPLNIGLYKMAGKDRHGAWFARRSVHEGMGFAKFRTAMMREFPESLAVQGGPGEGNVRGIGGDQRLEKKEIEGVGTLEVFQLSAQFPGPTTPREFITLLLTTDHGMSEMSAAETGGGSHVPRSFMIVSKPTSHPDAPERQGYIRGHYESVELIREIPISTAKSKSTSDLLSSKAGGHAGRERAATVGGEKPDVPHGEVDEAELNPVEWIMITRSEPGGGIPRFMVERGTPGTMISDLHKWLDWATNIDESKDPNDVQPREPTEGEKAAAVGDEAPQPNGKPTEKSIAAQTPKRAATVPAAAQQQEGVISHLTQALEAGIDAYAPAMVSSYLHGGEQTNASIAARQDDDSDSSSISSDDSFHSTEDLRRLSTARANPDPSSAAASTDSLSIASLPSPETLKAKNLNQHDKEVLKLAQKRDKLDKKLAQKREQEEERLKKAKEHDDGEKDKARERYDREVQKSEEKHRKEMEKLERKKEKEAKKAEQKRLKREDRDQLSRVSRERDEFRSQSELWRKEVEILHEQVSDLQRENTAMAVRLGKLGGPDALRGVREEVGKGHSRAGSTESLRSNKGGLASDSSKPLSAAVEGDKA